MKRFLGRLSLEFLTPWHSSVLNAKSSTIKSNNGIKLIKPQYSYIMNMKLIKNDIKK